MCTSVGTQAFANCTHLVDINMPLCTSLSTSAFNGCKKLVSVDLPACEYISGYAFGYCESLATISFPKCSLISTGAFIYCLNLLSAYFLGSSVPSMPLSTAFASTPISNYTTSTGGVYGSIYVRASLYDAFISATNWTLYSSRIVSLTDAEIEALG